MKVLLIGDLRCIANYGAIATTESLYTLIKNEHNADTIDTIDYRSIIAPSPQNGFLKSTEEIKDEIERYDSPEPHWKRFIKSKSAYRIYKKIKNLTSQKKTQQATLPHVPYKLSCYADFSNQVLNNEKLQYEYKKIKAADIIIINGEGNLVKGTDSRGIYRIGGLYILFMAYFCKTVMNKKTYIVNHTVDPQNDDIKEIIQFIYPLLDGVYVRERLSLNLLNSWGVDNARFVPDALFSAGLENKMWKPNKILALEKIDFSSPFICIGDSSAIQNKNGKIDWDIEKTYIKLINSLKTICPQIVFVDGFTGGCEEINNALRKTKTPCVSLKNANYKDLYQIFKHCSLFISGRWHASILSLMAGCPILLWGADSHKTRALYELIDYPFDFFEIKSIPDEIQHITLEAKKAINYDMSAIKKRVNELSEMSLNNVNMLK